MNFLGLKLCMGQFGTMNFYLTLFLENGRIFRFVSNILFNLINENLLKEKSLLIC